VEVVKGDKTTDGVADRAYAFAGAGLGKSAVRCGDTPGFIVNR